MFSLQAAALRRVANRRSYELLINAGYMYTHVVNEYLVRPDLLIVQRGRVGCDSPMLRRLLDTMRGQDGLSSLAAGSGDDGMPGRDNSKLSLVSRDDNEMQVWKIATSAYALTVGCLWPERALGRPVSGFPERRVNSSPIAWRPKSNTSSTDRLDMNNLESLRKWGDAMIKGWKGAPTMTHSDVAEEVLSKITWLETVGGQQLLEQIWHASMGKSTRE